jgi:hypothetical protein
MREVRDEPRKGAVLTSERERPEKAGWEAGRKRCSRVSYPLVDSQAMQLWQPGALLEDLDDIVEVRSAQVVGRSGHVAAGTLTMGFERRIAWQI